MMTPYMSEILEEKKQSNNQSLKPGFQYFNTLIFNVTDVFLLHVYFIIIPVLVDRWFE